MDGIRDGWRWPYTREADCLKTKVWFLTSQNHESTECVDKRRILAKNNSFDPIMGTGLYLGDLYT